MRRIVTAREQFEMMAPWLEQPQRIVAKILRMPEINPNLKLAQLGYSQGKFNKNFMSWMNDLSDQDKEEGLLWYPVGHDFGEHTADRFGVMPTKAHAVVSATSPQRLWYGNMADAHDIISNHAAGTPELARKPPGKTGGGNLVTAHRVMGAPDDRDAVYQAFLGKQRPTQKPKTYDFLRTLDNPEEGGAGNWMAQPGVVDSHMGRSMMWSKDRWLDSRDNGGTGRRLDWPGRGTGEGLDEGIPEKLPDETGQYVPTGKILPAKAKDVALRVGRMGGAYNAMRNAMRYGAARHDMPYTHGAQAAVWKAISGNQNPTAMPTDRDLHSIGDTRDLYDELWARRANSGLIVPSHGGLVLPPGYTAMTKRGFHPPPDPEDMIGSGPEDAVDLEWGTPEHFAAIARHIQSAPPGWDHWEGRPGLSLVASIDDDDE